MVCGAILAGGQARRFGGRDKSQLLVEGRTILARQLETLQGLVDRIVLVGYHGDAALPPTVGVAADRVPDSGPLGGLDAALTTADGGPVLLLACDMPFVTRPFLSSLLRALDDADAVVPRTEHGYHPLCAVYGPSCLSAVRRRLDARQLRLRDLCGDLRVRVIEGPALARFGEPSHLLANVNTQADLDALDSLRNH